MRSLRSYFRSTKPTSLGRLASAIALANANWRRNQNFGEDLFLVSVFNLPDLKKISKIPTMNYQRVIAKGMIDLAKDPFPIFEKILMSAATDFQGTDVQVKIGFEEIGSRQNSIYHDSITIRVVEGIFYVIYWANGSVLTNLSYRREFMRRLVVESHIPLNLIEKAEHYELAHSRGGRLQILDSEGLGRNPTAFSCEIADATVNDLIVLLRNFLEAFGSSRKFRQFWRVATHLEKISKKEYSFGRRSPEEILYDKLTSDPELFPASSYIVQLESVLRDVSPLGALRPLWAAGDRISSALAAYETPDGGNLSLHAITQDVGHWLWVEVQGELGSQELESHLGIEFEEIQEGWAIWDKE